MRTINHILVFVFVFVYSCVSLAQQNELQDIQLTYDASHTQLILTLAQPISQQVFKLSDPDRVVIDLENTTLKVQLDKINVANSAITQIRAAQHNDNHRLRIVLDLKEEHALQVRYKELQRSSQTQIIIDLLGERHQQQPTMTIPTYAMMRDVIVIIDPGHGGQDPGATGSKQGLKEKNIVLAIAKDLEKNINTIPGITAILTRNTDHYIPLRERLDTARKYQGDLFISIHADAYVNKHAQGASVFTLSSGGASSEAARWLAEKENYSQLGGVDLNILEDEDNVLRSTLIDLSQLVTINQSLSLGHGILDNLGKVTRLHHGRVEQAGFLVLKSPDIPSVLIETGFISNPTEESNLGSRKYRSQIVQAISNGVLSYLSKNAPPGSMLDAKRNSLVYQVIAGDNLSRIALREKTSVEAIKKLNGLNSDMVKIGQTLLIPKE